MPCTTARLILLRVARQHRERTKSSISWWLGCLRLVPCLLGSSLSVQIQISIESNGGRSASSSIEKKHSKAEKPAPPASGPWFAIDLGTTHCGSSDWPGVDGRKLEIAGRTRLPSVVELSDRSQCIGEDAANVVRASCLADVALPLRKRAVSLVCVDAAQESAQARLVRAQEAAANGSSPGAERPLSRAVQAGRRRLCWRCDARSMCDCAALAWLLLRAEYPCCYRLQAASSQKSVACCAPPPLPRASRSAASSATSPLRRCT